MAKRVSKKATATSNATRHFELANIKPLTMNQERMFDAYNQGYNIQAHGSAGSGKTFLALYLALKQLIEGKSEYKKIIIIRSVVPSRDVGFLPGTLADKIAVYEEPYIEICNTLFGSGTGWDVLKAKKLVEFTTTSFLRGTTFHDSIVIIDESNNMSQQEIDTVMTRIGENTRVIICGDFKQSDLKGYEKTGLRELIRTTNRMKSFAHIEFVIDDIVRSSFVKEYLIAKEEI